LTRFKLDAIALQPWRNRAGSTRVLAEGHLAPLCPATGRCFAVCALGEATGDAASETTGEAASEATGDAAGKATGGAAGKATPDWRISVAEIEDCASFSVFPGIDRCAVLIGGHTLVLHTEEPAAAGDIIFPALGASACFAGEARLVVREAAPGTRLFNLMTRRGRCAAEVRTERGTPLLLPTGAVRLLLVVAGNYVWAEAPGSLSAGEGLFARAEDAALALQPTGAGDWLVAVTVRPAA